MFLTNVAMLLFHLLLVECLKPVLLANLTGSLWLEQLQNRWVKGSLKNIHGKFRNMNLGRKIDISGFSGIIILQIISGEC